MLIRLRAAVIVTLLLFVPSIARADVVLEWNELMVRTFMTQTPVVSPFAQARFASIVQLAVFEAVNAITGDYEPYIGIAAPVGASPEAAAIAAAHRVLKTYFPTALLIDDARTAALAAIPNGPAKTNGIDTGERAAAAMIALRANDHSSPLTTSPVGAPDPGVWQLTPMPVGGCAVTATGGSFYNWQDITPFGIPDVQSYLLPPPPDITSNHFAKDYNDVKVLGRIDSTERPTDRTDAARFFQPSSPTLIFNSAARQIAAGRQDSLTDNARALALINMATNDSLVASFYNKYHYNYWRPETAIRLADDFGNRKVTPDTEWRPYIATPCFPSYPSNHASGSTGAAETLRRLYGEGGHSITISNPFNASVAALEFTYTTFNQILNDVDDARVYGGIHYWFDQKAGGQLGRAIATYVYKHNLKKVNRPK